MMKTNTILPALALSAAACLSQASAATFIYDIASVGAQNTLLSTDGWTGDDIDNWVVGAYTGAPFARNQNDNGEDTITRATSLFSVLSTSNTTLSIDITGRFGGTSTPIMATGIADGTTLLLGVQKSGSSWTIVQNGTASSGAGGVGGFSGSTNIENSLRLVLDYGTSTIDLIHTTGGSSTVLIDDYAMDSSVSAANLAANADGLYIRTDSKFVGPSNITITSVVPEPSAAALLGLGGLALMLRRRKG
ncbi:MAG: PEP-CTERM sorting domain-containing protein [Akkermansiaceae bacterium]|nr:PEP-CTERM sorting domain-containing protein [Akkermansiaceae bacterium]